MKRPDLITRLLNSPLAAQLAAKDREEIAAQRVQVARVLAELERQHASRFPQLRAAVTGAEAEAGRARAALAEAERKLQAAWQAEISASLAHANRCAELENELKASADPAIVQFCQDRRRQLEEVRRAYLPLRDGAARTAAVRWALAEAESLMLVVGADVAAALQRIAQHIELEVSA